MEQSPSESCAVSERGERRSPSSSSTMGPAAASATAPALDSDPGLEATLLSYSDLKYRDAFWPNRKYEDSCDRLALRAFLPPTGDRLIEVGAGFGRLADEYAGYREVVLLDASQTLLQAARERLGDEPRFTIIAGDAYRLPFPDASFDAAVCVRVMQHFEDPRAVIRELSRVVRPGGVLVLEAANKRNLKAILAYLLHRQRWSPFSSGSQPYEDIFLVPYRGRGVLSRPSAARVPATTAASWWTASTTFLHAPRDVRAWLNAAGFKIEGTRSVGLFRLPFLTSNLPARMLVGLERLQQPSLAHLTPGPSIFVKAVRLQDSSVARVDRIRGGED